LFDLSSGGLAKKEPAKLEFGEQNLLLTTQSNSTELFMNQYPNQQVNGQNGGFSSGLNSN
jgi:hypothetical protein